MGASQGHDEWSAAPGGQGLMLQMPGAGALKPGAPEPAAPAEPAPTWTRRCNACGEAAYLRQGVCWNEWCEPCLPLVFVQYITIGMVHSYIGVEC